MTKSNQCHTVGNSTTTVCQLACDWINTNKNILILSVINCNLIGQRIVNYLSTTFYILCGFHCRLLVFDYVNFRLIECLPVFGQQIDLILCCMSIVFSWFLVILHFNSPSWSSTPFAGLLAMLGALIIIVQVLQSALCTNVARMQRRTLLTECEVCHLLALYLIISCDSIKLFDAQSPTTAPVLKVPSRWFIKV